MLKFSRSLYPLIRNHSYLHHAGGGGGGGGRGERGGGEGGEIGGGGGARGKNLEHLVKVVFLCWSFLEVYIFATTYRKAFIVGPKVPYLTPHLYPTLPHPSYPTLTYPYPFYHTPPHLLPHPYPCPTPPIPSPTPPHPYPTQHKPTPTL